MATKVGDDHGRHDRAGHLGGDVGKNFGFGEFAPEPDGQGDGGIVMGAGDVAAGVDHDHEHQSNGQRAEGALGKRGVAHSLDEKKGADEFDDKFVHGLS